MYWKQQGHVLQDIRAFLDDEITREFGHSNFGVSSYITGQGKELPCYTMTKDGYTLLGMGFAGKKALRFKLAYINAFNAMADPIASHDKNLWQKMQVQIVQEVESKVKASFGSYL